MARPITDPKEREELLALVNMTEPAAATSPAPAELTSPKPPREPESDTPEALDWVRGALSGDVVAAAPKAISAALSGSQGASALEDIRRTRGQSPELRAVEDWSQGPTQFATNVMADAVGMVASKVAAPIELAVLGSRIGGRVAGGAVGDVAGLAQRAGADEVADWLIGKTAAKAIAKQQRRGEWETAKAVGDAMPIAKEFAQGFGFGMNPAMFTAGQTYAETGDGWKALEEGYETFKKYPLASMGVPMGLTRIAATVGGDPVIRNGEPVQTVRGEPVKLNRLGQALLEPATKLDRSKMLANPTTAWGQKLAQKVSEAEVGLQPIWQRLMFDVVPNDSLKAQRAQAAAVRAANKVSPAVRDMQTTIQRYNVLRDLDAELSDAQFAGATAAEKFGAVEGRLPDTEAIYNAPVSLDGDARQYAQALGQTLVDAGIDQTLAQQMVPYVMFEGVRAVQRGQMADPVRALESTNGHLQSLAMADRQVEAKKLASLVQQQMQDPTFLAAADQAWSTPAGGYKWVPGSEVRQRDGYLAALKAVQDADAAAGRKVFTTDSPELGQLQRDYVASIFTKLVDDVNSTPDGRMRVAAVLRSNPLARLQANPSAPPHIQALANFYNSSPTRRRYADAINKASLEIADNLGVDPVVIARNYDRYMSRAFNDALDAQVKLEEKFGLLDRLPSAVGSLVNKQTGRFKRQLDRADSDNKLMDRIANGELNLTDALAGTANQMINTAQVLFKMSQWHDEMASAGMISDKPVAGWSYTGDKKVADKREAASADPYNFVYGKLANKWVHPQVARQLGLTRSAMQKAHPVTQLWRLMKTVYNIPIYPLRNMVQDHGYIYAVTGLKPTHGEGRRLRLGAQSAVDNYVKAWEQGQQPTMSPMMLEAIEQGKFDPEATVAELQELPSALRASVAKTASQIANAAIRQPDPIKTMEFMAESALALKAGVKLPNELRLGALKAWQKSKGEARWRDRPSKWLEQFNHELARTTAVTMMAQAEQSRRLYTYTVAREKMGLSPEQAGLLVDHAVYGSERPSETLDAIMKTGPGQLFLPPFLRFGLWQAKNYTQRALNDPTLHMAWALSQGLSAANEEDLLQHYGRGQLNARLTNAYLQRNSAPDVGLGSAEEVADVVRTFSPRLADNIARRSTFLTMSLKDVGGYNSFLSSLDPSLSGVASLVQHNEFARLGTQFLDPQLTNPITGRPEIMEGDPSYTRRFITGVQLLAAAMMPQHLWSGIKTTAKIGKSLATGEPVMTSATGKNANVIDATKYILAPLGMQTMDQVALGESLRRKLNGKMRDTSMRAAKYKSGLPVDLPPDVRNGQLTEASINAYAKLKQIQLSAALAYGNADPRQVAEMRQLVETKRKQALAARGIGESPVAVLSQLKDNDTLQTLIVPVQEAIDEIQQEQEDDNRNDADTPNGP